MSAKLHSMCLGLQFASLACPRRLTALSITARRFQDHASSNVKNISLSVIQPPPDVCTPSVTRSPATAGRCTRKPRHSVLRRLLVATADGQSQLPTRLSRTPKVSGTLISEEGVCHESLHSQRSIEDRWIFHCKSPVSHCFASPKPLIESNLSGINDVSSPDGTHIDMSSEVVSARGAFASHTFPCSVAISPPVG